MRKYWFRGTYYYPKGSKTLRGFKFRCGEFGMALHWGFSGSYHRSGPPFHFAWNHGPLRFAIFRYTEYDNWLEQEGLM